MPLPDEEIARITNLVREAVGYNADRGDTINVASGAFAQRQRPLECAEIELTAPAQDHALLASLGDDLKFVLIVSKVTLREGDAIAVKVTPSEAAKCERCWHYRDDVGSDPRYVGVCGRCALNLGGAGETRVVA